MIDEGEHNAIHRLINLADDLLKQSAAHGGPTVCTKGHRSDGGTSGDTLAEVRQALESIEGKMRHAAKVLDHAITAMNKVTRNTRRIPEGGCCFWLEAHGHRVWLRSDKMADEHDLCDEIAIWAFVGTVWEAEAKKEENESDD